MKLFPFGQVSNKEIKIRPSHFQFWTENLGLVFLLLVSSIGTLYLYISANSYSVFSSLLECSILLLVIVRYFSLKSCLWTIGEEVIYQRYGLISVVTDHVEMYRIIDYQMVQSPLQRLFGIQTIVLISTDKINHTLLIKGVSEKLPLMDIIRNRVEQCKLTKHIYEVTNP